LLLWAYLRDPEPGKKTPLDVVGVLLLVIGVGSLQYLLSDGERYDWFGDRQLGNARIAEERTFGQGGGSTCDDDAGATH
jgi:hypothetical protein